MFQPCLRAPSASPPYAPSSRPSTSSAKPNPSRIQIEPSRARPAAKAIKEKRPAFLGFPCPNRAFSKGCADPWPRNILCSPSLPFQSTELKCCIGALAIKTRIISRALTTSAVGQAPPDRPDVARPARRTRPAVLRDREPGFESAALFAFRLPENAAPDLADGQRGDKEVRVRLRTEPASRESDGPGLTTLLIMFVSSRYRVTDRPCGRLHAGGQNRGPRRPKANAEAPPGRLPSSAARPQASLEWRAESDGPPVHSRSVAGLAPEGSRGRPRAPEARNGQRHVQSGGTGSSRSLFSARSWRWLSSDVRIYDRCRVAQAASPPSLTASPARADRTPGPPPLPASASWSCR